MSKPVTEAEIAALGDFLFKILQGTASLGITSLGMVDLYNRARSQGVDFQTIFSQSPEAMAWAATLLRKNVKRLPAGLLEALKLIVKAAEAEPRTQPAKTTGAAASAGELDPDDV